MSQPTLALHQRDWTLADLQAMDDDGHRYEVVDGALLIMSPSMARHDVLASRLATWLNGVLPHDVEAFGPGGLQLGRTVRAPDVVVVRGDPASFGDGVVPTETVLLVVEVQGPSTQTTDRVTKPHEYAQAGIPHYWRLEPGEGADVPALHVHALVGDTYRLVGTWRGPEEAVLSEPFAMRLRPADLLRRP